MTIKALNPGQYYALSDITPEEYHRIARLSMEAGASQGEYHEEESRSAGIANTPYLFGEDQEGRLVHRTRPRRFGSSPERLYPSSGPGRAESEPEKPDVLAEFNAAARATEEAYKRYTAALKALNADLNGAHKVVVRG